MNKFKKGILLIGMSGCGKSTLGKRLADLIGYKFIDMDYFIEKTTGKTIRELFLQGEDSFRKIESDSCKVLSEEKKVVIASGGGVIKKEENMKCFKDFLIVFINRPLDKILEDIDINTRPLLNRDDYKSILMNMYEERIDFYRKYKDLEIINSGEIETVLYELKGIVMDEDYDN